MKNVPVATHDTELIESFKRCGLNEIEQKTYLALRSIGPSSLSPIATSVGRPVSTIQSIMGRLVRLGIVDITKRKSRQIYEAADPVRFKSLAERHVQDAKHLIDLLSQLGAEETYTPAKVRVYPEGRIADVLHRILESGASVVYEIASAQDLQELIGNQFHFTKRRVQKNLHLKSLRVEAKEIKKYSRASHVRELREARFLPASVNFRASLAFWNNTIALYPIKKDGLVVTIESASLRTMLQQLFDVLWEVSRRMETAQE